MAAIGGTPSGTIIAKDIRDLQHRPDHGRGLGLATLLWPFATEVLKRALDRRDHSGGNPRVARCRLQLVVANQRLDDPYIRTPLKQVRGKGMTQGMQADRLLDADRIGGLVEQGRVVRCSPCR